MVLKPKGVLASDLVSASSGELGDPTVTRAAVGIANKRMQTEILPLLSANHPNPKLWNPLRADFNGPSDYGMKLWLPDKLALEILRNTDLLQQTAEVVVGAVTEAALARPKDFVTNILDHLMSTDG